MKHEHYLPIVLSALTVLLLGCWNPTIFRVKDSNGNSRNCPNYLWLALFSLLVGFLAVWFYNDMNY